MENLRETITAQIILALENGTSPWTRGWTSPELPRNAKTGQAYRGINFLILQGLSTNQFTDPRWLTFKQAESMDVKIKKTSKGCRIVKMVEVDKNRAGALQEGEVLAEDKNKTLVLKSYVVFNAEQTEGLPALPPSTKNKVEPVAVLDAVIEGMKGTGLTIQYGGGQPSYAPLTDTVRMPLPDRFNSTQDFSATFLHELAHSTGNKSRLNRLNLYARFGSEEYSREELRAEMASAFLGAQLGVPLASNLIESHASYIKSWLTVLKQDKNEIFRAAADAQKIADYMGQWAMHAEPEVAHVCVALNANQAEVAEKPSSRPRLRG